MPEQLALRQRLGHVRAVQRDEGSARALAARVDRARQELLARARLADDQHGQVALGSLACLGAQRAHAGAVADEALEAVLVAERREQPPVLAREPTVGRGQRAQLLAERLDQLPVALAQTAHYCAQQLEQGLGVVRDHLQEGVARKRQCLHAGLGHDARRAPAGVEERGLAQPVGRLAAGDLDAGLALALAHGHAALEQQVDLVRRSVLLDQHLARQEDAQPPRLGQASQLGQGQVAKGGGTPDPLEKNQVIHGVCVSL